MVYQPEDLSSDPQYPFKSQAMAEQVYNPNSGGGVETTGFGVQTQGVG